MTVTKTQKAFVRKRAKYHCEYCKRPEKWVTLNFEAEHIKPQSKGGSDDNDNLACACRECNQNKSNHEKSIDPQTNTEVQLFHPRKDNWSQHFEWDDDKSTIIAKTSVGRATIALLKMNESRIVEARKVWYAIGWQPPSDE